jgi:hypothetical protein
LVLLIDWLVAWFDIDLLIGSGLCA